MKEAERPAQNLQTFSHSNKINISQLDLSNAMNEGLKVLGRFRGAGPSPEALVRRSGARAHAFVEKLGSAPGARAYDFRRKARARDRGGSAAF